VHWSLFLSSSAVFETFRLLYKGLVIIVGHGEHVCEIIHNIIDLMPTSQLYHVCLQ